MDELNFPEAPKAINVPDKSVTLEKLAYLWQVDNPDWLAQREADWLTYIKPIFQDYPKAEKKLLENYFKFGKKDEYYPEGDWFFLTPIDSVETLKKVINSALLGPHERKELIRHFLDNFDRFDQSPWYQSYVIFFIKSYLSDGYIFVTEGRKTLSPPPYLLV